MFDQLFDYELWAMEAWRPALARFKDPSMAERIFRHIIDCYWGWLSTTGAIADKLENEMDLDQDLPFILKKWQQALGEMGPDHPVTIKTRNGDKQVTLGQLAHHVLNHGTYHRGHLRGLAQAEGLTDFPETDYDEWFTRQTG